MHICWNNSTDLRVCEIFKNLNDLPHFQKHIRLCLYRLYASLCDYISVNKYCEFESLVLHKTTGTPKDVLDDMWSITFENGVSTIKRVEELIQNKVIRKVDKMLFTCVDIETTGLNPSSDEILSFSYLILDKNGNKVRSSTMYFYNENIRRKWSEEAYAINGLSLEFLKENSGNFEEDVRRMFVIISKANLVTYNGIRFDIPFCKNWIKRNIGVDALEAETHYDMYKIMSSHGIRGKLGVVADKCGIPRDAVDMMCKFWFEESGKAHESHYDVVMTTMLLQYALNKEWIKEIDPNENMDSAKDLMFEENKTFESDFLYLQEENGNFYKTRLCTDPSLYWYVFSSIEYPPAGAHIFKQVSNHTYEDGTLRVTVLDDIVTMEVI